MYALSCIKVAKAKQWIFSKIKSNKYNQTINIEIKNRYVQFCDPTSLRKGRNNNFTYMASP